MPKFLKRILAERIAKRRRKDDERITRAMFLGMEPMEISALWELYLNSSISNGPRGAKLCAVVRHIPDTSVVHGRDLSQLAKNYLKFERRIIEELERKQ